MAYSRGYPLDSLRGELVQYDITLPTADAIRASKQVIVPMSYQNRLAGLQLGPDGHIWCAQRQSDFVSYIEFPNVRGVGCGFKREALKLLPGSLCGESFPVMPALSGGSTTRIESRSVCVGDVMSIPVLGSFVTDSVVWNFGDPSSGGANTGSGKTGLHRYTVPGSYQVRATMYVGSVARPAMVTWVYVYPIPIAATTVSPLVVCDGDVATLKASGSPIIDWYRGTTISPSTLIASGATALLTDPTAGVYSCVVSSPYGCADTTTVTIQKKPSPTVRITSSMHVCAGIPVDITADVTNADSVSWRGLNQKTGFTWTKNVLHLLPLVRSRFIVTAYSNNGCSKSDTIEVWPNIEPIVDYMRDTTICTPDAARLWAYSLDNTMRFEWRTMNGTLLSTRSPFNVQPDTTTWYVFAAFDTIGCVFRDTIRVSVMKVPRLTIQGDTIVCNGQPVSLTVSGQPKGSPLNWYNAASGGTGVGASTTITVTPSITTTYRVETQVGYCTLVALHTVLVGTTPPISAHATPAVACEGDSVALVVQSSASLVGSTIRWTNAQGSVIGTSDSVRTVVGDAETYTVTVTDSVGCSATQVVTIISGSSVSIAGDSLLCSSTGIQLTAMGVPTGANISWIDDTGMVVGNGSTVTVNPTRTTTYRIRTIGSGTCATARRTVRVGRTPEFTVSAIPTSACVGDSILLVRRATAPQQGVNTVWKLEQGGGGNVLGSGDSLHAVVTGDGRFTAISTDSVGCSASQSVMIRVIPPNGFGVGIDNATIEITEAPLVIKTHLLTAPSVVGAVLSPVRLRMAYRTRSMKLDSITGPIGEAIAVDAQTSNGMLTEFDCTIPSMSVNSTDQIVLTLHARPLVDVDSTTTITAAILEIGAIATCAMDSTGEGLLTITGCGRGMISGISLGSPTRIGVHPNPVSDRLNVDIDAGVAGTISVQLVDAIGRVVSELSLNRTTNDRLLSTLTFDLTDVASGMHAVVITTPTEHRYVQIVVRK